MPTIGAEPPAFVPLASARLYLRPFSFDDAGSVQHFLGNEDLAKQTVNLPYPFAPGVAETWIRTTLDDLRQGAGTTLAVERREDGALLGAVGLILDEARDRRAELGYWIARTYWGNGFATEAVNCMIRYGRNELGLTEFSACTFIENQASMGVLLKTGFKEISTREEDCPARGGMRSITYFELRRRK